MKLSLKSKSFRARRAGEPSRGTLECIKLCKDAGFDTIDIGFPDRLDGCDITDDQWETYAHRLAAEVSKLDITVDQAHAPFEYRPYGDVESFKEVVRRTFEVCAIFGVKNVVAHAPIIVKDYREYDSQDALNMAYDFYAPFVEQAKRLNLNIAFENLFDYGVPKGERRIFCSTVEEQISIIDKFNDPCVTACWDFGHAFVSFKDEHLNKLERLGSRVSCTHVHDNLIGRDLHLPPFLGNIKWEEVMVYLKQSGYKGNFTYEMPMYGPFPDEMLMPFLEYLHKLGTYLLSI